MIIHIYFTNGFLPWAKLFVESFRFHNGTEHQVVLTSRGLLPKQVKELNELYPDIQIDNSGFDIEYYAKKSGVPKKTLLKYKHEMETDGVSGKNRVWKLMIAGDERVKSVYEMVKKNVGGEHKHILHFDADMYIRAPLDELFDFVRHHDISMRLRPTTHINRKTMIALQGYKIGDKSLDYLRRWIAYIDKINPLKRPLGYGQTSSYYAYLDVKDSCNWGSVPVKFISAKMRKDDIIWASKRGKIKNLEIYRRDFKKWQTKQY
jgi:hypothetical protein